MLFQIGTNQFLVIKKTWPNVIILSAGAIVNIILNIILIPKIGLEGASLATFIGYFISIVLCIIVLKKFKLIEISKRLIVSVILFFVSFAIMRINNLAVYYINIPVAIAYCLILLLLYRSEIKAVINKFKKKNVMPVEVAEALNNSEETEKEFENDVVINEEIIDNSEDFKEEVVSKETETVEN